MIEIMTVGAGDLPPGREWLVMDLPDGRTIAFLSSEGAIRRGHAVLTVRGMEYEVVDPGDALCSWEWSLRRLSDGRTRVVFNRESATYRLGYVACGADGIPLGTLQATA